MANEVAERSLIGKTAETSTALMMASAKAGIDILRYGGKSAMDMLLGAGVPEEDSAAREVLEIHAGSFAVAPELLGVELSDKALKERAQETADVMEESGLIDKNTVVEVRPLLGKETTQPPDQTAKRDEVVEMFAGVLEDNGIVTVRTYHPIIPGERATNSGDPTEVWRIVAPELDGFEHEIDDKAPPDLMVVAIGGSRQDTIELFSAHPTPQTSTPEGGEVLVMEDVGDKLSDIRLVGVPHSEPTVHAVPAG